MYGVVGVLVLSVCVADEPTSINTRCVMRPPSKNEIPSIPHERHVIRTERFRVGACNSTLEWCSLSVWVMATYRDSQEYVVTRTVATTVTLRSRRLVRWRG